VNITLDIKTLIAIGAVMATMGGFYYSTQHRLSNMEDQLADVAEKIDNQTGQIKQMQRQIKRLGK